MERVSNFFAHWAFGVVIAFGVISLGILGSSAIPQIHEAFASDNVYKSLTNDSIFYIFLSIVVAFLYMARDASLSYKANLREKELNRSIQTSPPYELTRKFEKIIQLMAQYDEKLLNSHDKVADREVYIRVCLDAIASLAKLFHNASNGHRFAANVMGKFKTEDLLRDVSKRCYLLKFSEFTKLDDIEKNCAEYLCLIPELSSSTDSQDSESVDQQVQHEEVFLPLSCTEYSLLPGASSAFYSNDFHDLVTDCQDIFQGSSYSHLSKSLRATLDNYFNNGQGSHIGSILSIRLTDESDDRALGVVNIHSDLQKIFTNRDKRMMFIQLISPIMYKIHRLMIEK